MSWFNTYSGRDGDGLTRKVVTEVDLSVLPLGEWTLDELGLRLAILFPQVDGLGHLTASGEVMDEIDALMAEIRSRGFDPVSNLQWNENVTGFGWLNWFDKLKEAA